MPGARIRCTVTMKLRPVRMDENPATNTPTAPVSTREFEAIELYGV